MGPYGPPLSGSRHGPPTSASVDIATANNVSWTDSFQFDPPSGPYGYYNPAGSYCYATGTSGNTFPFWNFSGQNFRLDIKGNRGQTGPLLSVNSQPNGSTLIVVDDPGNRILHLNVPEAVMNGQTGQLGATGPGLIPGEYVYDFIMYDGSTPPVRVALMHGRFVYADGISGG